MVIDNCIAWLILSNFLEGCHEALVGCILVSHTLLHNLIVIDLEDDPFAVVLQLHVIEERDALISWGNAGRHVRIAQAETTPMVYRALDTKTASEKGKPVGTWHSTLKIITYHFVLLMLILSHLCIYLEVLISQPSMHHCITHCGFRSPHHLHYLHSLIHLDIPHSLKLTFFSWQRCEFCLPGQCFNLDFRHPSSRQEAGKQLAIIIICSFNHLLYQPLFNHLFYHH